MSSRKGFLSDSTRVLIMFASATLVLALINTQIAGKLRTIREGTTVLLPLAPRDPRSLIQGDYMALRYRMAAQVASAAKAAELTDGLAVIQLDALGKASFVALAEPNTQLAENQLLLMFRKRGGSVRLASDAFFFEEGQWDVYGGAQFGEIRVDADGHAVLTGLRGADAKPLGNSLH